ncbi:hypothetical protein [Streptomyces olivaceiscleroticus]|uniref:Uncharacterized protein n=1 Tax=Streptomyces olivaceiscleroticus TaxID=68245 RepID=A0ABP3JI22_9ACTN
MNNPRYYMATTPDGVIPASVTAGTPVNLADHIGQVIDHPSPGRRWYDDSQFSYFRMVRRAGEVLEDTGMHPIAWPVRLWIVEPVGPVGNWASDLYPYRTLSHQVRVVAETDAWQALGPRGDKVLDYINVELPAQARAWAAAYAADPQRTQDRHAAWNGDSLCGTDHCSSGRHALAWAAHRAFTCRREAALRTASQLATAAAEQAVTLPDDAGRAYVTSRAIAMTTAVLLQDRLRPYLLNALRGVDLDVIAPAPDHA